MEWQNILFSVLGVILTGIVTIVMKKLTSWLGAKTENAQFTKILSNALGVVESTVKATYQTYVGELKDKNMFDTTAQKTALNRAKDTILLQLSSNAKRYITDAYGDVEVWITSNIESAIYNLKNQKPQS